MKWNLLVHKWDPVGDFVAQIRCFWAIVDGTLLESLSYDVPMIGWPLAAEQTYNVKMLVDEMGVAVELTRTVETTITGEQVQKVIDIVMDQV